MNAVKNVAHMETFEGEYTLTDLIMKARCHFGKSCRCEASLHFAGATKMTVGLVVVGLSSS